LAAQVPTMVVEFALVLEDIFGSVLVIVIEVFARKIILYYAELF
jgi:hypothetical protein